MQITKVDPYYLRVPMRRTVADSFNVAMHVGLAGVLLSKGRGLVGNGFTATLATGDDLIRDTIERYYALLLMGRDPHYVKQNWHDLLGRQGITTMAMAAVDITL